MLNEKAAAAVRFAEICSADMKHTNECSTPTEDCDECKEYMGKVEFALEQYEAIDGEPASAREELPFKRGGYTQKMDIGGHKIYVRTGEYPDGRLGDIFLDIHKQGAAFRSLMACFAVAVSLGLQYGVPLKLYVDKFVGTKFKPDGVVQNRPGIGRVSSLMDAIFKDLALSYDVPLPDGDHGQDI